MMITDALGQLVDKRDLSQAQMHEVMMQVMTGGASDAQIGALLVALRMKGEVEDEIIGAARVMRDLALPVSVESPFLVDTCGTGGDGANLFNVSTASAFVAAAAGAHVAKHGNRSVSSFTGSADLLESAGVNLKASPAIVARAIREIGVGFMFAPAHHGAMKHAIGPRRELAMRTIFNILGPITNPAGVKRQVLGVFDKSLCLVMAKVLKHLGSVHVMVLHSEDGLDEISPVAKTHVAELKEGDITQYQIDPTEFGCSHRDLSGLSVSSAADSLKLIRAVFSSDSAADKASDMVKLNAGAAIYVSGVAATFKEGVAMAEDAIASGAAKEKVKELAEFSCVEAKE